MLLGTSPTTHIISNMIYGVRSYDALTLIAATIFLEVTGLVPARQAGNVDWIEILGAA